MHAVHRIVDRLLENEDEEVEVAAQMLRVMGGKPRRVKGPNYTAIKYPNGREIRTYWDGQIEYRLKGKLHREDGPAIERADGDKQWWLNGQVHRKDGPAYEHANGTRLWLLNDKLHREDGPAKEWADGSKEWWVNGKRHREDGPAFERANGTRLWFLNNRKISEKTHARRTQNR